MRLKGKVCVVTGSCKGIGASIVERFLKEGAIVVTNSRKQESVDRAVSDWKAKGFDKIDGYTCDVTDKKQVAAMMEYTYKKYGTIDVLVNNAGINKIIDSFELSPEDFRSVLDTNLCGPLFCCQEAGKIMKETGGGSIINIASVFSQVYTYKRVAYSCSKTAILALTNVLAVEWADYSIRVTAVAPGWLKTDMDEADQSSGGYTDEDIIARTPLHRYGKIEDVANAVLYLASDEANYVTGTCFNVDGGWISYGGWCR